MGLHVRAYDDLRHVDSASTLLKLVLPQKMSHGSNQIHACLDATVCCQLTSTVPPTTRLTSIATSSLTARSRVAFCPWPRRRQSPCRSAESFLVRLCFKRQILLFQEHHTTLVESRNNVPCILETWSTELSPNTVLGSIEKHWEVLVSLLIGARKQSHGPPKCFQ